MLEVRDVDAYYGKSHILHGVSLQVGDGEVVALLGRNGAGKSTMLKTIMALVPTKSGSIVFGHRPLDGLQPFEIARMGVCYVPESRGIFGALTAEQNLLIAERRGSHWSIDDTYRLFPRLRDRRGVWGDNLSGGEQQMLAIARALVNNPKLLLLDEPAEGLAPVIVEEITRAIPSVVERGVSILLVEQNIEFCTKVSDVFYVLETGRLVYEGDRADFALAEDVRRRYLSLESV